MVDSGSDSDQWDDAYTATSSRSAPAEVSNRRKPLVPPVKGVAPHLLTGRSFLEQQCHWFDHPHLVLAAFAEEAPLQRLFAIVRWYFSALNGMHQEDRDGKLRKPYNPILGEQLHAKIDDDKHRIEMLCEQVSHHPPITAFHFENLEPGFSFYGTVGDRSKFRGTYMRIKTSGSAILHLRGGLDEKYTMNYPSVDVTGVLTGKTKGALSGTCEIQCEQTKLVAKIKFADKGAVKIRVGSYTPAPTAEPSASFDADVEKEMAVITGTWNKSLVMGKGDIFWEPPLIGTEARKYFKPSALLGDKDSWKVWEMVTLHLAMGMLDQAGQYKHALEEAERAKTKARAAANHTWMPEYFNERSPHMIRDRKVMEKLYQEAVWDNATVEISLPVVTREPISMDDE